MFTPGVDVYLRMGSVCEDDSRGFAFATRKGLTAEGIVDAVVSLHLHLQQLRVFFLCKLLECQAGRVALRPHLVALVVRPACGHKDVKRST